MMLLNRTKFRNMFGKVIYTKDTANSIAHELADLMQSARIQPARLCHP